MGGTEHILLGLLEESEGVAVLVLKKLGVDIQKLEENILDMLADNQYKATTGSEAGKKNPLQI